MEALAKHDFVANDPETELAFRKGDKLNILNFGDQVSWYNAEMGGHKGLVPGNYIDIEIPSWYMGRIPRATAEQMLQGNAREGAFLVRLSESAPTEFSLSVKCGNSVQHFRILKDEESKYFLWSDRFNNVNELVEHYRKETAIYDFTPDPDSRDEETEIYFKKNDLITVFDTTDPNWWGGRIGEQCGYFPRTYVKPYEIFINHE